MKKKSSGRRVILGIFVLLALILFTTLVFYIGSKQHIFGARKEVVSVFKNVSGLVKGNMVRYSGVSVGTVKEIIFLTDSTVSVTMSIDEDVADFIKEDSYAQVKTDGLIGAKYISIIPGSEFAQVIDNGDTIPSKEAYDIEQFVTILEKAGESTTRLTGNLESITEKIDKGEGTLGMLISDDKLHNQVSGMISTFEKTGKNTDLLTENLRKNTDLLTYKLIGVVDTLSMAGKNTVEITENLSEFTAKLNDENNTIGKLVGDTTMAMEVDETLGIVRKAAQDIEVTSCRVRNSWIMRLFSK